MIGQPSLSQTRHGNDWTAESRFNSNGMIGHPSSSLNSNGMIGQPSLSRTPTGMIRQPSSRSNSTGNDWTAEFKWNLYGMIGQPSPFYPIPTETIVVTWEATANLRKQ